MVKFNIQEMIGMAHLMQEVDTPEINDDELRDLLTEEARHAGVLNEALGDGLTMKQWQIVRNPYKALRTLVLEAEAN